MIKTYRTIQIAAKSMGEYNDCSVRALAATTDYSYRQAHEIVRTITNRKRRKSAKNFGRYLRCFTESGYSLKAIDYSPAKTIRTFQRLELPGKYLVIVSNGSHVLGVTDGEVIDWANNRCHHLFGVFKVEKSDQPVITWPDTTIDSKWTDREVSKSIRWIITQDLYNEYTKDNQNIS
jgi:hypothetical protein